MVEQAGAQELTTRDQKQDCGCGCGGGLCGAARQDCGCGCGGELCGSTQQELVWVDTQQLAKIRQQAADPQGGAYP